MLHKEVRTSRYNLLVYEELQDLAWDYILFQVREVSFSEVSTSLTEALLPETLLLCL